MAKSAKPVLTDPSLLSFDEAKRLIGEAATSDTILVGGQAIEFWAAYYGIEAGLPAVTRDIDFLGSLRDAMLADAGLTLPHKLHKATLDDARPNTGVISVRIPGKPAPTPIDYLCAIEGVSTSEARKMAVEVRIEGVFLKVLHPLLCLESKVTNLWKFPSKRRAEGVEQARMATAIVSAYLGELLESGSARDTLKAIERVLEFALSRQSHYAALACGIDTLEALPLKHLARSKDERIARFMGKRWPLAAERIESERAAYTHTANRMPGKASGKRRR